MVVVEDDTVIGMGIAGIVELAVNWIETEVPEVSGGSKMIEPPAGSIPVMLVNVPDPGDMFCPEYEFE